MPFLFVGFDFRRDRQAFAACASMPSTKWTEGMETADEQVLLALVATNPEQLLGQRAALF